MAVSRQVTTTWKRSMEGFRELNDAAPQRKARKRACAPIAEQQPLPSPRRSVSLRACSSAADGDADPTPADDYSSGLASTVLQAPLLPIAAAALSPPPAHGQRCDTPAGGDEPTPDESGRPSAGCRCPPSGDRTVRASPRHASLRRHPKRSQGAAAAGRCQQPSASSRERANEHEIQSSSQVSSSASDRSSLTSAVTSQLRPLGSCSSGDCVSNSYEVAGRGDVWRTFVMQQHKGLCRVLARKVRRVRHATYHKSARAATVDATYHKSARAATVDAEREPTPAYHDRPPDGILQPQLPGEARDSRQQLGACEEAADDHGLLRQQQPQTEQEAYDRPQQMGTREDETDDDTLAEPKQGRHQHVKLVDAVWAHQSPILSESLGSRRSLGNEADGASRPSGFPEAVLPASPGTSRSQAVVAPSLITDAASGEHAAVRDVSGGDGNDEQTSSASVAAAPDDRAPAVSAGSQACIDQSIVMTQWSLPASIASGTIDSATPAAAADLPERNEGRASCHDPSPAQSAISESVVISELPTQNESSSPLALCHPGLLCNCADRRRRDVQPSTSGMPLYALPCNCSSIDLDTSLPLVLGEPCEGAGVPHSSTRCPTDGSFLPKRPQRQGQIAPAARRPRTVIGGLAQRLLKVISRDASARAMRSHDLRSGAAVSGDREHSSSRLVLEVLRGSVDADGVPVATCLVVGDDSTSVGVGMTVAVVLHDFVATAKQSCGLPVGAIVELFSPWTIIQGSGDAPLLVSSSFCHIRGGSRVPNRERPSVDIEPVRLGSLNLPMTLLQAVRCPCIDMATSAHDVPPCNANVLYTGIFGRL